MLVAFCVSKENKLEKSFNFYELSFIMPHTYIDTRKIHFRTICFWLTGSESRYKATWTKQQTRLYFTENRRKQPNLHWNLRLKH